MNDQLPRAVCFDIGHTLGSAWISFWLPHWLEGLDVYPQVRAVLKELRDHSVQLGIICYVDQKTEENVSRVLEAHLYNIFEPRTVPIRGRRSERMGVSDLTAP
jgi:hypothetical protein